MSESEILKETNPEQHYAYEMIAKTSHSFFLTGKAGTGKTTFIRKVCKEVPKNFLLLAPTGLAAMNLGGQTIHSFFGFKFGVLGPGEIGVLGPGKINLIKHIDTIIIDEVSMVRCDLIDAIDRTLRHFRKSSAPFGGIQMVFTGDMFQLEPVVLQDERNILREIYETDKLYFYNSFIIRNYDLPKIEFLKVYRQSDSSFIELLDHFRTGKVTLNDLMNLNSRHSSPENRTDGLKITLTANNRIAKRINDDKMKQIGSEEFTYTAHTEGDIRNLKDIVECELTLKAGAQVMFIRNDPFGKWVNGTLATVSSLSEKSISVIIENMSGTGLDFEVEVEKVSWEAAEQVYDKETKSCTRKVIGRIQQYPLRPAWAITIHKSQGLTFDRVAIDLGSGSFASGQTYVALSRAKSLEGLELINPISAGDAIVSREVIQFASEFNDCEQITKQIHIGEAIETHLKSNDFDGASRTLYTMACEETAKGNLDHAYYLMSKASSYLTDDSCLDGMDWTPVKTDKYTHDVLNAYGLFYSGHKKEALQVIQGLDYSTLSQDFDALYLLARCQEESSEWDQMWNTYDMMTGLYLQAIDKGIDSQTFRKYKYRMAVLRERHDKGSGIDIIRKLIKENPKYNRYYHDLRGMLWNYDAAYLEAENSDNVLMQAVFDLDISNESFVDMISKEQASESATFIEFMKLVNRLELPKESFRPSDERLTGINIIFEHNIRNIA